MNPRDYLERLRLTDQELASRLSFYELDEADLQRLLSRSGSQHPVVCAVSRSQIASDRSQYLRVVIDD